MKKPKKTLSFDDVLLVPQKSDIESRSEVDISGHINEVKLAIPIISSPMDTVTESDMAATMSMVGGLGIIHRYNTIREQTAILKDTLQHCSHAGAAVGVTDDMGARATALVAAGASLLCIDVAHGHHTNVERAIKTLRDKFGSKVSIMAGNVATAEGFADLQDWGADVIRVGVGGGSICSTRIQTAHGVPTFQSVLDCSQVVDEAKLVADGGIKNAGDIVKCLAAGADFVMLGSLLAGTQQSPGEVFKNSQGQRYKSYRGMASREAQVAWRGKARSLEGVATTVPYKGDVEDILADLTQNIRSGLSYSGARSISEFREKVKVIQQTSAGMNESRTHILSR